MFKSLKVAIATIAALLLSGLTPVPADATAACTITITTSNTTVDGTANGDVICINADNVTINAVGGNDTIVDNGTGNIIYLGDGNDIYDGTLGDDSTVDGGAGTDTITGTPGEDEITGGDGDDTLIGGESDDTISGGDGADNLEGDAGADDLSGDVGDDDIDGGDGTDTLDGGVGGDTLVGGNANDVLNGGDGTDNLSGNAGDDNISGDAGNDTLNGGDGADTESGGTGDDTLVGGAANDVLSGGDGTDNLSGDVGDDQIYGDAVDGGSSAESGADTLNGGNGNDTLVGGASNDILSGGDGNDNLSGDAGDDQISGDAGNDNLNGGDGSDTVNGGVGDDTLVGGSSSDVLTGGDGLDNLSGSAGDDLIYGEAGSDLLAGGDGDDVVVGGAGIDQLNGGSGLNDCDYESGEALTSTCIYDDAAPLVQSFSVSAANWDVTERSVAATLTLRISDQIGLKRATVVCSSQRGDGTDYVPVDAEIVGTVVRNHAISGQISSSNIAGYPIDQNITLGLVIRQGLLPGAYGCVLEVTDLLNQTRTVRYPAAFTLQRSSGTFDDEAPSVTVVVTPQTLDSGIADNTVEFLITATDPNGPVTGNVACSVYDGGWYGLANLAWWDTNRIHDYGGGPGATAESRSATSVTFRVSVTVPKGRHPGTYSCGGYQRDSLGNRKMATSLATVVVTNSSGDIDRDGPTVSEASISPAQIDVGAESGSVLIDFAVLDNTAWDWGYFACSTTSGGVSRQILNAIFNRNGMWDYGGRVVQPTISGDAKRTAYSLPLSVPLGAFPGVYVCVMSGADTLGNWRTSTVGRVVVDRTPPGLPRAPQNLLFSSTPSRPSEGTLTWEAPTDVGIPELHDYEIQYSTNGTAWVTVQDGVDALTSKGIQGFSTSTNYYLRVRGNNGGNTVAGSDGASWSQPLRITTPAAVAPDAPTQLLVSSLTSTGFVLDWTTSAYNGGSPLTNFRVELSRDGGATWTSARGGTSTSTRAIVSGAAPGTEYLLRVAAINAAGASSFLTGSVTTTAVTPGAPINLASSSLTATTLTLGWDLPSSNGGSGISDYKVEFSSNGGTTWNVIAHDPSAVRSFNVTGLAKGRSYQFRVSAINEIGTGVASAVHTVSTLTTVPGVPTSVAVSSVTSSTATMSWTAPTDNGGSAITDYTLQTSRDEGTTWVTVTHTSSTTAVMNLTGLAPGTHYLVRVATKTAVGSSDWVQGELTTTAVSPGAPINLASSSLSATTLTLNWDLPSSNGGSGITDYKVEFSSNGGTTWTVIAHDASAVRSFNVTGLLKGKSYQFRVSAVNEIGTGVASALHTVSTLTTLPGVPTSVVVSSVTSSTARLSWAAPTDDGGSAITDYTVQTSRDDGTTWVAVAHTASAAAAMNFTGLAPGTRYLYRVATKTVAGLSDFVEGVLTTLTVAPGAPLSLASSSVTATALTLNWDLPTSNGGAAITDYKVEFSSNSGTSWNVIAHDASAVRSFNVTGLSKGRSYQFRVSAINEVGTGATSAVHTVSTLTTVPAVPNSVAVSSVTSSTASVTWTAPTDNGGSTITDYTVQTSRDDGATWVTVTRTASTSTVLNLTGLAPGTHYLVRVGTKTAVGSSDWVQGELTTTAVAPGAPLNLASSSMTATTLTLGWDLPTSNGGAGITDYRVEFSSNGGTTWNVIAHDPSAVRSFNVTGLTRATAYRFRVTAKNSIGYGTVSSVYSATTPFDVPGAPTALTKASITASGITLGWIAPTNNGGAAVSDYKVEVSRDSGSTWSTIPRAVSTSRTLVVTGLAPGTEYQVRVSAKNSAGFSTPLTGSFTTLSTVPGAISNLATSNVLGTSLSLTWDSPASNGGSAITNYQIQVSSNGTTFTNIIKSVSTSRTFSVTTGLAAGTKYWFRVSAINARGTGADSTAVNVVTVGNVPNSPTSLAVTPSTTSIVLSWAAATVSGGSAVRDYTVEYSINGGTSWTTVTKSVSTSRSMTVTGLRRATAYLFRVSAVNDVGSSTPSTNLAVTTR